MAWARAASEAGLGLEVGAVRLVPHDVRWSAPFDALCVLLTSTLQEPATIEHVGSTAVAGLGAKPILDVAVGVASSASVPTVVASFVRAGCIDRGTVDEAGEDRMLAIESSPGIRVAHVHVVRIDGAAWRGYLTFRDALRDSGPARRRYEAAKQALRDRGLARDAYRRGKAALIEEILVERVER